MSSEPRGVALDRTVFYAQGGGQSGDRGTLLIEDGAAIPIVNTVYDADRATILHVPAEGVALPRPGARVIARIDWDLRYKRMRAHTALHLLSVVLPYPVTGGSVGEAEGRLDFDSGEAALDKGDVERRLNELIAIDAAVSHRWIADEELEANPGLVKTMSVKPPMGTGRVRLVAIEGLDLQPCGGTHVARTGEIGRASVTGIEKKGKLNRRVRIALAAGEQNGARMPSRNFCTTAELAAELSDADLGVIDASWHLPNTGRIGAAEFRQSHIPGAVFFDIDAIADVKTGLPHMLPDFETLAKEMGALGLGDGMRFVVYDALGLFAAARVWWTLRAYGVEEVRILEGGLTKWIKEGRPLETRRSARKAAALVHAAPRPELRRLARRGAQGARERLGAGGGRASPRSLSRRSAGAAAGPEERPHARQPQPAVCRDRRARPLEAARGAQGGVRRARGRSWEADHHHLRVRGHGGDPGACGGGGRRQDGRPLRRLVGGMGLAPRRRPVATGKA